MRRVVITGIGIVSSIGNSAAEAMPNMASAAGCTASRTSCWKT